MSTWTPRPSLNLARGGLISATVDGRTYAIGGFTNNFRELRSVEVLEADSDGWQLSHRCRQPGATRGPPRCEEKCTCWEASSTATQ
jgi:hypothetical protein